MPTTPQDRKLPQHVQDARVQNAVNALHRLAQHRRDAQAFAELAKVEEHPMTTAMVDDHNDQAGEHEDRVKKAAELAGTTVAALERKVAAQMLTQVQEQVELWIKNRDTHIDMEANPDGYGWIDLGGKPLDLEEQRGIIAEYEAHIASAKDEVARLEKIIHSPAKKASAVKKTGTKKDADE